MAVLTSPPAVKREEAPASIAQPASVGRDNIYDWLRGWAILAVLFDHLRVFPNAYVIWSVNFFVMITAALFSRRKNSFRADKLVQRLCDLAMIYVAFMFFFDVAFKLTGAHATFSFREVLTSHHAIFVKNPYFGDIWYLFLHAQILIFFCLFLRRMRSWNPVVMTALALVISEAFFYVTHFHLHRLYNITIVSWCFYICLGFYFLPGFIERMRGAHAYRAARIAGAIAAIGLIYSQLGRYQWLFTNESRTTALTLPVYVLIAVLLTDVFFVIEKYTKYVPLTKGMCFVGRNTLALYITHLPFAIIYRHYRLPGAVVFFLSLLSGLALGVALDVCWNTLKKKTEKGRFRRLSSY